MTLLPLDIQNKSFETKMRGFDRDEVDDFLDQVASDYEKLNQKNRELERNLKHANEKLEYFNELKDSLNQSIIVAQDTAEKVKNNATNEADAIVKSATQNANDTVTTAEEKAKNIIDEATRKAGEILSNATKEVNQLRDITDKLKKESRMFHQRLMLMLEAQLHTVKSREWDDLLTPSISVFASDQELLTEILENEGKEDHSEIQEKNQALVDEISEASTLTEVGVTNEEER
ncbi:MAG: DivIVA domain-containing protein [Lactobacillales bacterium]|jgi:cell division initiation protein|nr:DivIVA domain-containing protein [Lactobacillales bacterium]